MMKRMVSKICAIALFALLSGAPVCMAAGTNETETVKKEAAAASVEVNVQLPEVKDFKTSEVCVLDIGPGTQCVGLGTEKSPAFPSGGPSSFAVDRRGTVYILDAMNFRVQIVSKEGKIIKTIEYPKGESDATSEVYFMRDIAVSPKDNNIYLLNATLRNIFIMSPTGEIKGEIDIKEQVKLPRSLHVAPDGKVCVKDEDPESIKTVVYSPEGKVLGRLGGAEVSVYPDEDGYLFTLGERDELGSDVVLMDAVSNRKPKPFAKMYKVIKKTEPYDYQVLGMDAKYNLFASIVEKIEEDVIQTIIYKFGPDGKVVSRHKVMPMPLIEDTFPTRYFAISHKGEIYAYTANQKRDKFAIVKIE